MFVFFSGGDGGRFRDRLAKGDLPIRLGLVVRSIGALGDAGEERSERPTGPMGEHVNSLDLVGEFGGSIDELRRSLGVIGDLIGVYCLSATGTVWGEDFVSGDG